MIPRTPPDCLRVTHYGWPCEDGTTIWIEAEVSQGISGTIYASIGYAQIAAPDIDSAVRAIEAFVKEIGGTWEEVK